MGCPWRTPPHSTPFSTSKAVAKQPTLWVQPPTKPVLYLPGSGVWFPSVVRFCVLHEKPLVDWAVHIDERINIVAVIFCRQWRGLAQFRFQPVAGPHELPHNQTCWTMTDMTGNLRVGQTQGMGGVLEVPHLNTTATTCHLCPATKDFPIWTLQINPSKPRWWSWNLQTVRGRAVEPLSGWRDGFY